MKPKHVGEQHKQLFSPEYNYSNKIIKSKKHEEQTKLAQEELLRYKKGEDDDTQGI